MQEAAIHTDTDINIPAGILRQSRHFYFTETDLNGVFIAGNDHFRRRFFSRRETEGLEIVFSRFLDPGELKRYREALRQCLLAPVATNFKMVDNTGTERMVSWEFHLAKDNADLVQAVGYDAASQETAMSREAEDRFLHLVYNLRQGILLHDDKGRLVLCNRAALKMLGLTEAQLNGTAAFNQQWTADYEDADRFAAGILPWQLVKESNLHLRDEVICINQRSAPGKTWLLVNADKVCNKDGSVLFIVTSLSDITEQRRLSIALTEQAIQRQKQITQAAIDAQEKERLLIGKELHDNISQHLTTTRLYLEVAMEKSGREMMEMVSNSHNTLLNIIHQLRSLSQALAPPTLGDIGLEESLYDLADTFRAVQGLSVTIYCPQFDEEHLPANLKMMLFRVIQEHLADATRHFGATVAEIRLHSEKDAITLTITDNREVQDSLPGIKRPVFDNITNRVSLFNGFAEETNIAGGGCILSVNIPLPAPAEN